MKQHIPLNTNQVINILKRYNSKFSYKLTPTYKLTPDRDREKEKFRFNDENIIYIDSYIIKCIYVNEKLKGEKLHLVLKYSIDTDNYTTVISLNILLDDYKDLIS